MWIHTREKKEMAKAIFIASTRHPYDEKTAAKVFVGTIQNGPEADASTLNICNGKVHYTLLAGFIFSLRYVAIDIEIGRRQKNLSSVHNTFFPKLGEEFAAYFVDVDVVDVVVTASAVIGGW